MYKTDPSRTRGDTIPYSFIAEGYTPASKMEELETYIISLYPVTCKFFCKIVYANYIVSTCSHYSILFI